MKRYCAWMQQRKIISYPLGIGLMIAFNCFGFPFVNLSNEWPLKFTAANIYIVLGSTLFSGVILAILFPKRKFVFTIFVTAITIGLGLLCRYFLEFGEVSNTYHFTLPNILLHAGIFLAFTALSWAYAVFKQP